MAKRGNNNVELADSLIRRLPLPAKGNKIHYDSEVAGFGVRVTAAGAKAFVLNYYTAGGRERRYTIGAYPDWTATAARKKARRLRQFIDDGGDPVAESDAERAAPTVAELCDRFELEHLPRKRASTVAEYRSMLAKYIRPHFGEKAKVADVTFAEVDRLHRKITAAGHPYRANRVMSVLSKMFALAQRWQMRDDNPVRGIERNHEAKRKRYLSGDELGALVKALAASADRQGADIVRLLLLTGARKGEVLSMRWADVDLTTGVWSKPASSTNQKADHEAPLSAPARQLLSDIRAQQADKHKPLGEYVFPSDRRAGHRVEVKCWHQLCRAAKISGLRVHDLRHSFASQLVSSGSSLPLIGALLGHANVNTTHRYAHLFPDAQRAAVERVGAVIEAAANGDKPAAEVSTFSRRRR